MNRYRIKVRWYHKKWGPRDRSAELDASSIGAAIGRGLKEFFGVYNAQQPGNRDAHKLLQIEATRLAGKGTRP